ncbi:HtaA domain-containing protein [Schaalia canis]|uniref:Htaa domain-containing protein n=1 Tax=Schaalia canis TaxID=100469 RepID=A0A3P1SBS7_9ACTO|nr:HtaA domain-containing protein [Schaalia canis]RRC94509.1 hypothetical protein EII11_09825 [Schaalia canis]
MRPVTKRALVTSVVTALLATASILPGNAAMASDVMPTADNAETVSSEPTVGAQTSPDSAEAAAGDPVAPQDVPQEGGAAEGQPEASEPSEAAGSQTEGTQGNAAQGEGAQGEATPNTPAANDAADAPEGAAEVSEPEKTNYEVHLGFANWDFRRSFREYVGSENEDRTSVRELSEGKNLVWYPKQGQNIDVKNPTTLKFGGEVHWLKYGGVLDVKISNPTIDFTNKKLLVDAATKGTLAGGGAKTFTQQALLDLQDLTWEMRDGYLVIASHKPRITQMSKELVGFYHGEVGDPFVATIQLYGTNAKAPEPVLWKIFPDLYKDPGNKPLVDPNEAIVDVNVPDPTLAHCIRWELDLKDSTPITNKVIQTLQSMQCIGINKTDEQKIRSLQGLEGAKNLASIKFSHNAIVDLAPLAGLNKLHTVELDNNAITDLSPLADLTKLETLRVSNNAITTIPNFKKLENLGTIEAANNKIKDIAGLPVGSENLRILNFANNRIEDISPLGENFHTRELYLNDNRISDVTPLKRMRAMQKINVANNFITDPSTFATWPAASQEWFTSLHVSGNRFSDWTGLESLGSKLKDKPAAGQEAQAMNPRTLEETLAADKKADEPQTPAPPQADAGKKYTADLNWGIRKSFLDYVTGPIAHGKVEVSEGATGRFVFPLADGATLAHGNFTGAEFKGKVRFLGHGGLLDLTIANPAIVREGQAWKLMADVASRPFAMPGARPGSSLRAAASSTDAPAPARVHLANLGGMNLAHTSTGATVSFSSVELTEQGAQAFGGFYKAGNRALDALTVSLRAADAPKDTPKDQQPKTEDPKENPKGEQPKTEDPKENPKGEQPKDNSSADTTPQKFSPTLTWGVREQFRSYLKGLAKGSWTLSEGATGEFNFPSPKGVGVDLANYAGSRFAGKVHFTGHHGLLDITIANPEIVRSGNTWTLVADVASRPYDAKDMALLGNPEALKKAAEGKAAPQLRRVTLATLSAPVVKGTGKDATITFAKLTLTKEGSVAFGGFYAEGASDFDPITISAGAPVETPKTGDGSTDNNATDDSTKDGPKKNEDPTTKQPNANGGTPDVKKQKKECAVDPHRKRITSGSLSWGVRSSFTTYVRGSIAKGGWNLNGVTWDGSTFNFPVSGGLYNTSTGSGTIYYSGTVQFYGHNGILDLTMSNPAVQINGNSGTLYMTVSGSDTSGNKFNLGRVAFASLGFNGVSASDSGLSFDGASVTLTDTGAKAFAGFYAAGTALDPMSSSASLAPATACDPETGELIEYDAFGDVTAGGAGRGLASTGTEAQALVWMSLMVLALGAAAVGMSGRGVRARQHH